MPQPKKLQVPYDFAKQIWEKIQLIFELDETKKKHSFSQYFDELGKKSKMKSSFLQYQLYEPLKRNTQPTHLPLSMAFIKKLCEFIDDELLFKTITTACETKMKDVSFSMPQIWKKEIPQYFINTQWYNYEHHTRGISRDVVMIHDKNEEGYYTAEMHIHEETHESYVGFVVCDNSQNYLILHYVTKESSQKYMHQTIHIGNGTRPTLCIGHDSYHSTHNGKLLTKTVVWQKVPEGEQAIPLFIPKTKETASEYGKLHWAIKRFLKDKSRNRLSSPTIVITNLTEFEAWFQYHDENNTDDVLAHFMGEYYVYYAYTDKKNNWKIREDDMQIRKDEESKIEAIFQHRGDDWSDAEVWENGKVYRNHSFLSFFFLKSANQEESTIFAMANIPIHSIKKGGFECFPGMISGIKDTGRNMVSYLMLLVRKGMTDYRGINDERIQHFFLTAQHEKRVSPPNMDDYTLDELLDL